MAEVFDFGLQQHKIKMDGKFFENNLFAVAGDTGRRLEVQLLDSSNMVQNTTGVSLRLNANVAGQATYAEATSVDATKGLYELDLPNGMLMAPGNWQFQWQIIGSGGEKLHSFAFMGSIGSNLAEGATEGVNFYLNLQDLKAMQEDLINGTFDSEILETNITEKLTNLETQYAPKLTEVTAQLAQIVKEKIELNKTINEHNKNKKKHKLYVDDFTNGLNNWQTTNGFVIDSSGELTVDETADEPPHTNIALFDSVEDAKSIEITLGSNPRSVRIAFAKDTENFLYITRTDTAFQCYNVEAGVVGSSKTITVPNNLIVEGDKLKVVLFNQNLQFIVNGQLFGIYAIATNSNHILPKEVKIKAGVTQRDTTTTWGARKVKVLPKQSKYMHFSIDDCYDLSVKRLIVNTSWTSIFENPYFNDLKTLHDKYGAVFSLYCFYTDGGSTTLADVPSRFRDEFRENAHWLKLGFHGYNSSSNYSDGSIDVPTATTHYNDFMTQIRRFAHPYAIDTITRTSFFTGSLDICRAFKNSTTQIKGFFTADDDREVNLYLNDTQKTALKSCDDYYDEVEKLYFVRTDLRMELFEDPVLELNNRLYDHNYVGQNDILEIFTHEGIAKTMEKFENVSKWAIENGYYFDFPSNNIPPY